MMPTAHPAYYLSCMIKIIATVFALALSTGPLRAAPQDYALDPDQSQVRYEVNFGSDVIHGTMPVASADVQIDFARVSNSRVDVTLSPGAATANFPLAAQALRGPRVLAADAYPAVSFVSSKVQSSGTGAVIEGDITIRNVTRPIALDAAFFRPQGTAAGDRSELWIRLTGAISRAAFGAGGFGDLVDDEVRLNILAKIDRVEG